MLRTTAMLLGFALLFAGTQDLVAAPAELLNKNITVGWTGTIQEPIGPAPPSLTTTSRHVIYVSSAGRLFTRSTRSGTSMGGTKSSLHEVEPGGSSARSVRFQGNSIVGNVALGAGAWQFVVSFDPGFRSCNVSVIYGKAGGNFRWTGMNGTNYQAKSITASGTNCSVAEGNPF